MQHLNIRLPWHWNLVTGVHGDYLGPGDRWLELTRFDGHEDTHFGAIRVSPWAIDLSGHSGP